MSTDAVLSTPLIISFGLCGPGSLVFETVRPWVQFRPDHTHMAVADTLHYRRSVSQGGQKT